MENEQDVKQTSSPALEQAIASSPEALEEVKQQISEEQSPTAEQGVAQEQEEQQTEEARVPYSRLKEVIDEKNWLKAQLEQTIQRQQIQQPISQPQPQDLFAGKSPEERVFYQGIYDLGKKAAQDHYEQNVRPAIDAGRQEIARIGSALFFKDHPDIKVGSIEEQEIARRVSAGYLSEDAYRAVMWDKKTVEAEHKGKQQVKQQMAAKKMANVEASGSIPPQSQPQGGLDFEQELAQGLGIPVPYKLPPLKKR